MKFLQLIFLVVHVSLVNAQFAMPVFLKGTWKVQNKDAYEHWDIMHGESMKGISYTLNSDIVEVREYLDISIKNNEVRYTAYLYNQNDGKGTAFIMKRNDTVLVFENPDHEFPNRITYKKSGDNELFVRVENLSGRGFEFNMNRHPSFNSDPDCANPSFDKDLASKLGGDDYGMKSYFFVILKTGTTSTSDAEFVREKFRGHMVNITRLVDEGKLIVAGPFGKNDFNFRGLFILTKVKNKEEAKNLLQTDPAVSAGLLDADIFEWYGSAALPEYLKAADKIWKVKP